jgi:hypothetical protein
MKRNLINFLVVSVMLLVPSLAMADTVEGTVQGFSCVVYGKVCPQDMGDPVVGAENTFVIVPSSGEGFYIVPNLDRAVLARRLLEKVRVKGMLNKKYNSIMAETVEAWEEGKWVLKWSMERQQKMLKELYEMH